jgi:hypothetical protein
MSCTPKNEIGIPMRASDTVCVYKRAGVMAAWRISTIMLEIQQTRGKARNSRRVASNYTAISSYLGPNAISTFDAFGGYGEDETTERQ